MVARLHAAVGRVEAPGDLLILHFDCRVHEAALREGPHRIGLRRRVPRDGRQRLEDDAPRLAVSPGQTAGALDQQDAVADLEPHILALPHGPHRAALRRLQQRRLALPAAHKERQLLHRLSRLARRRRLHRPLLGSGRLYRRLRLDGGGHGSNQQREDGGAKHGGRLL